MDMVERVAQAMFALHHDEAWQEADVGCKEIYLCEARVAIKAIDPIDLLMAGGMTFPDAVGYLAKKWDLS